MARPKTTGNGRLRKLECPADGMIAYVSRGAVIRHGLPFCGWAHMTRMLDHLA